MVELDGREGRAKRPHVLGVIDADGEAGSGRELHEAPQAGRPHDLVSDEDVVEAGVGEGLGLADLGAADSLGTREPQTRGDLHHAVGLDVRAQSGTRLARAFDEAGDVGV